MSMDEITRICTRCSKGTETAVFGNMYVCDACDRDTNSVTKYADTLKVYRLSDLCLSPPASSTGRSEAVAAAIERHCADELISAYKQVNEAISLCNRKMPAKISGLSDWLPNEGEHSLAATISADGATSLDDESVWLTGDESSRELASKLWENYGWDTIAALNLRLQAMLDEDHDEE